MERGRRSHPEGTPSSRAQRVRRGRSAPPAAGGGAGGRGPLTWEGLPAHRRAFGVASQGAPCPQAHDGPNRCRPAGDQRRSTGPSGQGWPCAPRTAVRHGQEGLHRPAAIVQDRLVTRLGGVPPRPDLLTRALVSTPPRAIPAATSLQPELTPPPSPAAAGQSNAKAQPRPKAGAQRTLEGVGCSAWFGAGWRLRVTRSAYPLCLYPCRASYVPE
jgi:hypothetical protein